MPTPSLAIVRAVPGSFASALCASPPDPPIDVTRARAQHAAYAAALAACGLEVLALAADESCPDCCFVEDAAVVVGEVALVTRQGAVSRRGEREPVAQALAGRRRALGMDDPATLDGGDCLRLGRRFFVGRSARSNAAGIARLAEVAAGQGAEVVGVDMPRGVLHLKSVCAPLDDETVLLAEGALPSGCFGAVREIWAPREEAFAANAVAVGQTVVMAAGAPRTAARLAAAGFRVVPVDTAEMRKADGALTCLSILL